MGATGPLPEPTPSNVRSLRGEAVHSKRPASLKAVPRKPIMPAGLDSVAKRTWRETAKDLDALAVLAKIDREPLAAYCRAVSMADRCWKALESEDIVVQTERGDHANPTWLVYRQAVAQIESLGKQLGCTPASRLRMPRPEPDDEDLAL